MVCSIKRGVSPPVRMRQNPSSAQQGDPCGWLRSKVNRVVGRRHRARPQRAGFVSRANLR